MGGRNSKNKTIKLKFERSELAEYKEAFDIFDENRDGHITMEEIGKIMKRLNLPIKEAELHVMMDKVDVDASGTIDFGEFLIMMKKYEQYRDREMEIHEMFNVLDIRRKGLISHEDLKIAMANIGEEFTDEDIDEMMEEADRDCDGYIDFHEFQYLCKKLNL